MKLLELHKLGLKLETSLTLLGRFCDESSKQVDLGAQRGRERSRKSSYNYSGCCRLDELWLFGPRSVLERLPRNSPLDPYEAYHH